MGYIAGIGAINLDIMNRSAAPLIPEDSNPGTLTVSVGGVTHNVLENACRLGIPVRLITAIGDDLFARVIREGCAKAGIPDDDFVVFPGHASSTYTSVHEPDGEMHVAVSDMHVLQNLTPAHLEAKSEILLGADAVIFDTGLPEIVIRWILDELGPRVPVFCDPVSTAYARKLAGHLKGLHTLKPNRLEAEILSGLSIRSCTDLRVAAARILKGGVKRVFISLGRSGVYFADDAGAEQFRPVIPLDRIENATGAGDSMLGALLWAFERDLSLEDTLTAALTASRLTMMSPHTIRPDMSEALLYESIRSFPLPPAADPGALCF